MLRILFFIFFQIFKSKLSDLPENKKAHHVRLFAFICGEGGIRTHDTVSRIQTFQACSFGHSDTSPEKGSKFNKITFTPFSGTFLSRVPPWRFHRHSFPILNFITIPGCIPFSSRDGIILQLLILQTSSATKILWGQWILR